MGSIAYLLRHVCSRFNANEGAGSARKAKNDRERNIPPHHIVLEDREDIAGRVASVAHDPEWNYDSEESSNVQYDDASFY